MTKLHSHKVKIFSFRWLTATLIWTQIMPTLAMAQVPPTTEVSGFRLVSDKTIKGEINTEVSIMEVTNPAQALAVTQAILHETNDAGKRLF